GMNLGMELSFILYGILSVFFIQELSHMLFSIGLSMISYFMLAVVWKNYHYQLEAANVWFYLFNQLLAMGFIFYGLFLIKKENTGYQFSILAKNRDLHRKNLEIEKQKKEIADSADLLGKQKGELTELNALKNKLFSVIAHDLKSPIYALHNLFRNMQQYDLPAEDIKQMIPDVVNDLNFTTGLMENLLQWARSQMQQDAVNRQLIDVSKMADDVIQLLRLPAEAKELHIINNTSGPVYAMADKDMVNLVLRNLLSNAIKFTPAKGDITIDMNEMPAFIEVSVEDTGMGMTPDALRNISKNDYYTTKGTANESGTGLGLMLCKEFLARNGGQMSIESDPGKGSTFSFTLPRPA
ncbi:MAG TPA: HAMP domain-containing sensor histidine kinase, partial [Chitinophagaceae bacterium]|nr:HAMP domain-containing sensor histidine kinase [Chitinophagaceae bacterium]